MPVYKPYESLKSSPWIQNRHDTPVIRVWRNEASCGESRDFHMVQRGIETSCHDNSALKDQYCVESSASSITTYSTWYSQAVSHPSTHQARPCWASKIRRNRLFLLFTFFTFLLNYQKEIYKIYASFYILPKKIRYKRTSSYNHLLSNPHKEKSNRNINPLAHKTT